MENTLNQNLMAALRIVMKDQKGCMTSEIMGVIFDTCVRNKQFDELEEMVSEIVEHHSQQFDVYERVVHFVLEHAKANHYPSLYNPNLVECMIALMASTRLKWGMEELELVYDTDDGMMEETRTRFFKSAEKPGHRLFGHTPLPDSIMEWRS